ncbi:MAG: hypothetical protein NZM09_10970 [Ignavibacterium sp.]|nr:hypothetical protein [Ignavibacterium sp.]MDW8376200.1 hypothetical protein [Ignavibacteriales bacterium]
MKIKNQKIIDFFEGNLSEEEKTDLLKEVNSNLELKKEFESFKKLYSSIDGSKNVKISDDYYESILLRFRNRNHKVSFLLKPVFVTISVILLTSSLILFLLTRTSQDDFNQNNDFVEINGYDFENVEQMYKLVNEDKIIDLLFDELINKEENIIAVKKYLQIEDSYYEIPESDAEDIYQELLNKKIL